MKSSFVSRTVFGSLLAIGALASSSPIQASPDRISEGQAQAVLQAFGSGGLAILGNQAVRAGTPADSEVQASIRPFAGSLFDGRHYCAEDWHVIMTTVAAGGDRTYSRQEAGAELDPTTVSFELDSNPLASSRTAIKWLVNPEMFGREVGYYFQQGAVLAPSELTIGGHTAAMSVFSPGTGTYASQITFYIDAPGSGACVEAQPI
jgi:hypothetical protein